MIKYIIFTMAFLAILPLSMLLVCQRYLIRWTVLGLLLPVLIFNSSAINFYSHEFYRGTSRGMEISIIYIIAIALLLTIWLLKGRIRIFPDRGSLFYLLYFLLSLPSVANAENRLFSFFEIWKMLMIYLVFLAVYNYLEYSGGDFDIFLYGLIVIVGVNFVTCVLQHFSGVYQVRGLFPHQNSLAMYMVMVSLLFFSRYFNRCEGWRSWLFFSTFVVAAMTFVRTYSRGALACFPLGGIVTLFYSLKHPYSRRKLHIVLCMSIFALVGLSVVAPRIIERFEKAPESSGQTRKELALAAVNMMKDAPLIGVGINNWGIKINPPYRYCDFRENRRYSDDFKDGIVETIYLLVGAECGIPALVLLLVWFSYYWIVAVRLLVKLQGTPWFFIPAGALGGMTNVFLQSALEWVLKQQINFLLLVTFFAFLGYLNRHWRKFAAESISAPKTCVPLPKRG